MGKILIALFVGLLALSPSAQADMIVVEWVDSVPPEPPAGGGCLQKEHHRAYQEPASSAAALVAQQQAKLSTNRWEGKVSHSKGPGWAAFADLMVRDGQGRFQSCGFGWATGAKTRAAAEQAALDQCRDRNGSRPCCLSGSGYDDAKTKQQTNPMHSMKDVNDRWNICLQGG